MTPQEQDTHTRHLTGRRTLWHRRTGVPLRGGGCSGSESGGLVAQGSREPHAPEVFSLKFNFSFFQHYSFLKLEESLTYNLVLVQVCNMVIWYVCVLWHDDHDKSTHQHTRPQDSLLLMRTCKIHSPCCSQIHSTVLVTTVAVLSTTAHGLFSYTWKFSPFNHLYPFLPSLLSCLCQIPLCSLYL